jgi:hypothetical protein
MTFLAVSVEAPPGRALPERQQVQVTTTLDSRDDLEALRHRLAALWRRKSQRLTREAQDQGAPLTQEDLARVLSASRSTFKWGSSSPSSTATWSDKRRATSSPPPTTGLRQAEGWPVKLVTMSPPQSFRSIGRFDLGLEVV